MEGWHELTGREKAQVRRAVRKKCASYDSEYGCLPLECDCYMFGIGYRESGLCRYFRDSILPDSPELLKVFSYVPGNLIKCAACGQNFVAAGNKRYCSDRCADMARKKATAARVRRLRAKHK